MTIAIPAYFILAALLCGTTIAFLGPKFGILTLGLFAAPAILFISHQQILFTALSLSLVLVGISGYFFKASIHWGLYLIGLAGYFVLAVSALKSKHHGRQQSTAAIPSELAFFALFALCLGLSTIRNPPGAYHLLIAVRDYFFLMSLYFIVSRLEFAPTFPRKLWLFLWSCALLQLPFALYQFIFVARQRKDAAQWDAIVGTFVGTQEGGGDSGNLTVFLFAVLVLTLELYRQRVVTKFQLVAAAVVVFAFVALSEVKIAFVLIAVIGAWQLFGNRKIQLSTRVAYFLAFAVVSATLFWLYAEFRQDTRSTAALSGDKRIERSLSYSLDPTNVDAKGDVGRLAAITLWAKKNPVDADPFAFFLGHGAGSTQISREGFGHVASKFFPLHVDTNTAAVLLWDSGLIGTLSYLIFLGITLGKAWKARDTESLDPWEKGFASAAIPILIFYSLALLYNKGLISGSPPSQTVFFIFAAFVSRLAIRKQNVESVKG